MSNPSGRRSREALHGIVIREGGARVIRLRHDLQAMAAAYRSIDDPRSTIHSAANFAHSNPAHVVLACECGLKRE
jgi:hypothetical protein